MKKMEEWQKVHPRSNRQDLCLLMSPETIQRHQSNQTGKPRHWWITTTHTSRIHHIHQNYPRVKQYPALPSPPKYPRENRICWIIFTWRLSLHLCPSLMRNMLHMDPWNESFIRNVPHPIPSIILEWLKMPTLQDTYVLQQEDDMGVGPQMSPIKQIKYSGLSSGSSNSKWPSEMKVDKYPVNKFLLTQIETNTQKVIILRHIPLLPSYQHMYRKYIPSTNHPTRTCLGSNNGHTILVQISSCVIPSSKGWYNHQVFNQITNHGGHYCRSWYKLERIYILQTIDQEYLPYQQLKVIPRI